MIKRSAIVISPWLPTGSVPYAGTFVVDSARYLRDLYLGPPVLVHLDDTFHTSSPWLDRRVARHMSARTVGSIRPGNAPTSIHVPLPVPTASGWDARMEAARLVGGGIRGLPDRISSGGPVDVHAHVGVVSGPATLSWGEGHRLVVYEHASFVLDFLSSDSRAREEYGRVVGRADALLCVNPAMAATFRRLYPESTAKIHTHPNPVDFDRFRADRQGRAPTRWLYIGNLKASKGTRRLVAAFRAALDRYPDLTLTLVGRGPDVPWLRAQELGERLRIFPPVPAGLVPDVMASCDVLLHLSERETFGLTALEAVASGMPVIVTSTDGSEHTLRPVVEHVGAIVPQPGAAADVIAAYAEIRHRPPDVDAARLALQEIYSPKAVAASLNERLAGYPSDFSH